ncbi:hypothetical protein D1P53_004673 [Cryptococcus gattii VGV]|nr:hypothetical protein D1P53_004673 [Cryptococcus gattii VGV]
MQFSTSTGDKNDPIENSVEIQTMLDRSIEGAKAFDRSASGMSLKIPLLDISQKTPSCFVDGCTSVRDELGSRIKSLNQGADFMQGKPDGYSHRIIESIYQNGYFTCSQHEDNVPNNYDPTVSTIVKCGLMLRPGLDDRTLDEWSIPGHRDRTLSSTRICDVDIPIRKGVHWPYTNEGRSFCSLAHAALHRRSVKQSQSRASRGGNGSATDRDFVDSTQKRKSTERTRGRSNTSFRLPQALIRARKQEIAPTKEKALECTQCSTADPSYPSARDVQLKRLWHRSEDGSKSREILRTFGGYLANGLEADWPYTTTVWQEDATQLTSYQCSAWCNSQSIASEASKLDPYETLYSQAFDGTSRPAKKRGYLGTMGPPSKPVSTLATPSRDMRSLTLASQPPSTVSDDREFSDIDSELLAIAGVDD